MPLWLQDRPQMESKAVKKELFVKADTQYIYLQTFLLRTTPPKPRNGVGQVVVPFDPRAKHVIALDLGD